MSGTSPSDNFAGFTGFRSMDTKPQLELFVRLLHSVQNNPQQWKHAIENMGNELRLKPAEVLELYTKSKERFDYLNYQIGNGCTAEEKRQFMQERDNMAFLFDPQSDYLSFLGINPDYTEQ